MTDAELEDQIQQTTERMLRLAAEGGLHSRDNLKMACARCNRSKGAKMPMEVGYQVV